ncbi:MAG: sigma-70 family RNA polymerase sigma factor [Planctomycetota bacterium]|jgi:RNA polymerase sigma factor (sigma-70 family)
MSTAVTCPEPATGKKRARAESSAQLLEQDETHKRLLPQIPDTVRYIFNDCFAESDIERQLYGPEAPEIEVPIWSPSEDLARGVRLAKKLTLTPEQETTMFLRYNYARYRLALLVGSRRSRSSRKLASEMGMWMARAAKVRANLVRANLALVYAMVKATRITGVETADLVSAGNMALLRSVDNFDVSRGARFSTYACRSILKSFSRLARQVQRQNRHLQMHFSPNMEFLDVKATKSDERWQQSVETLREILQQNQARLSEVERTIVNERFALGRGGKGRTLAEIAGIVGLTNERVRQLQILALSKIRAALEKHLAPSTGKA